MAQERGADHGDLVEVEVPGSAAAERALGHHRQHAGAGGGLEHGVARADGGGLERSVGERQRGRELLEPDLPLGALRVRGLERGDGLQHRQHAAGSVRARSRLAAHGAAVALDEQHDGGFGRLVGVLPEPGALGVARAMGAGHGGAERGGVERPAGFERGQQAAGRGNERVGAGKRGRRRVGDGMRRTRGGVRRRGGVEHGVLRIGMDGTAGRRRRAWAPAPPRRTWPGWAAPPPGGTGRGCDRSDGAGAPAFGIRHGGTGGGQPNLVPASANVHPLAAMASSTAASEVRCSYSRWSWR